LKFGAILASELVTKKQESFEIKQMSTQYNILCEGRKIYSNLTEEEYFDTMEDLAQQFYEQGSPSPEELETEMIEGN